MMTDEKTAETRVTRVFYENEKAVARYVVNEGGTRSTKTWSLCQLFIKRMIDAADMGIVISVVRKTFPSLKSSSMKDFFAILREMGIYNEEHHNQTDGVYTIGRSEIAFFSTDQPQKLRGRKQDLLWVNEANEITSEDFLQLKIRTKLQIFLDYNPSMETSWIYDQVLSDPDCIVIKSTYKDNPTLPPEQVAEIEKLKFQDEALWKIYGLGEKAVGCHESLL
jgi:phage terminase large subunit